MKVRGQERVKTHFFSVARVPGSHAEVMIVDVSETGCKIVTDSRSAQIGATIILSLPHEEYASGQMVWKRGDECGVHFHKPISLDSIDSIAAQIEQSSDRVRKNFRVRTVG